MSNHTEWLILSETLIVLLIFCLISQASSLTSSIILVPSSFILMLMVKLEILYSSMLTLMFIMIFIGGLMVLLVSVTSVIYQEQWISPSAYLVSLTSLLAFMFKEETIGWEETNTVFLSWFSSSKVMLLFLSLSILIVGLLVMSTFLLSFKSMIRSM